MRLCGDTDPATDRPTGFHHRQTALGFPLPIRTVHHRRCRFRDHPDCHDGPAGRNRAYQAVNRSVTTDLPVTGSAVHGRARHGVQRADRVAARGTCSPQGKRLAGRPTSVLVTHWGRLRTCQVRTAYPDMKSRFATNSHRCHTGKRFESCPSPVSDPDTKQVG